MKYFYLFGLLGWVLLVIITMGLLGIFDIEFVRNAVSAFKLP